MINITESAFARVRTLSGNTGSKALRISIEGGGCAGFSYKYEMTDDIMDDDLQFSENGAMIIIAKHDAQYMKDSIIDFVNELGAKYFLIKNPQAKSKCGCGNSFSIA